MKGKFESGQVRRLSIAVGYVFLLRLLFAARVELMPEETYYWNYSRHLDIGYLDHPPLTSWLIKAGTLLCGDTAFGVRLGALCCGVVASVFVFRLIRNVFGEAAALCGVVLAQALPFFFFSGLLMTPDAPLAAAWAAGLYFMERALLAKQSRAWLWLGVSIGLGLLSKYTIALLGVAAFGFMLIDEPSRRWFGRWQPYAALGLAASLFAPVLVWNARHEWASFAFQTSRRLAEAPQFALHKLIGAAIVLITPIGVAAVIAMLVGRARRVPGVGGTPPRRAGLAIAASGHVGASGGVLLFQPAPRGQARLDRCAVGRGAAGHGLRHGRAERDAVFVGLAARSLATHDRPLARDLWRDDVLTWCGDCPGWAIRRRPN